MTNHPDHVNRLVAEQLPTTLRVDMVSKVLTILRLNRLNDDATHDATQEKMKSEKKREKKP